MEFHCKLAYLSKRLAATSSNLIIISTNNCFFWKTAEKAKKKQFKDPFAGSGMELEEDDEAANEFSLLDRDD